MTERSATVASRRSLKEQDVLDVAATLLRARGFSATSVDDIAAAAGVNKAMLYYYFGSKAGILYRIYMATIDEFTARLADDDVSVPADEALARIIRGIVGEITGRPDYVSVFFQELVWLDKSLTPEQYETVRRRQAAFVEDLQGLIKRGMADGTFREVDPALAVSAVMGLAGWTYQWYGRSRRYRPEQLADAFIDLAFGGLRPEPESGPR